jgi:hypothetical protein
MSDSLETLLRQHDPAAGKSLASFDRTRILQEARSRRRLAPRTRMGIALAMALLLMITGVFALRPPKRDETPRQVRYATPGGTRVVWTLDPKFKM